MFPFFETITGKVLLTFGMAMVPVLELRGAIPMGVAAGLPPLAACLIAIAGNLVPVPFIILLIRHIFNFLRETRFFGPKIVALERRAQERQEHRPAAPGSRRPRPPGAGRSAHPG